MIDKNGKIKKIEKEELLTLIPHKGKMVLLSRILDIDIAKRMVLSEFDIDSSCIFYDKSLQGIPSWVGFECIAQSIAALSGMDGQLNNIPAKSGMILSLTNLIIKKQVLSSTITIKVVEDYNANPVFTFDCTVISGGDEVLTTKITVIELNNIEDIKGIQK
jgi:predicted hotdog family 3-hydroxylacyl-ACP dehydratase